MQGESETESSEDETDSDSTAVGTQVRTMRLRILEQHFRLSRGMHVTTFGYPRETERLRITDTRADSDMPAATNTQTVTTLAGIIHYPRETERRRITETQVDMHGIYGRSDHDYDTSTCDDGSEHDTTCESNNSEWEQDSTLLEAFECRHKDEAKQSQYDRTCEGTITSNGNAEKENSKNLSSQLR